MSKKQKPTKATQPEKGLWVKDGIIHKDGLPLSEPTILGDEEGNAIVDHEGNFIHTGDEPAKYTGPIGSISKAGPAEEKDIETLEKKPSLERILSILYMVSSFLASFIYICSKILPILF